MKIEKTGHPTGRAPQGFAGGSVVAPVRLSLEAVAPLSQYSLYQRLDTSVTPESFLGRDPMALRHLPGA